MLFVLVSGERNFKMRKTANQIKAMKAESKKIVMITAYDYPTAQNAEKVDMDIILVGDTLAMVVLGYENTRAVTMDDMLRHTQAVVNGNETSMIVGDMPYKSYEEPEQAAENARRFYEVGANAVKIEGNKSDIVKAILAENIPVMGHVGLTPQTAESFKVQGRDKQASERIIKEAIELEKAGCFSIVLECIPKSLAKSITDKLEIPTIGIGAGVHCDGQVLVVNDMLGLFERFTPRFVKRYANIGAEMTKAFEQYIREVREGIFPDDKHSYH